MSCKRRGKAMPEYVEESSSEEELNEAKDLEYDIDMSSSGRSAPGHQEGSVASNDTSEIRRRGRGASKRPCLTRNAQMARENRQRKKEYLENLENKNASYKQENKNLMNVIQRQTIHVKRLKAEVSYLKNVLNNTSTITALLKSMNETLSRKNGVKDESCVMKKLRPQVDTRSSNSSEKHVESSLKTLKNSSSTLWWPGDELADRKKPREISAGNLKCKSPADSDHTYTTSRDGSPDGKLCTNNEIDTDCYKNSDRIFAQDQFMSDLSESALDFDISKEIDPFPIFNENLFDSLGNEASTLSKDYLCDDKFAEASVNLFESMENSGVCLHVNSGKISLEFCSICHLNSINSAE